MEIRQLFDAETFTYSYLLIDPHSKEAAIIDPVKEQFLRDKRYIQNLGLTLKYSFETHIHADHVTASGSMRSELGAKTIVHKNSGSTCPDVLVEDGAEFFLGKEKINIIYTPGHTDTCMSLYIDGHVFTGDALLIGGCGRTDFQAGDASTLYDSITKKLFTLADDTVVHPGHDYAGFTSSTIGEEKKTNSRLGNNMPKENFVRIMDSLKLPNPKRMDVAVPGNLACGLD